MYELVRFDGSDCVLLARGSYEQMVDLKSGYLRFEAWLEERGF